MGTSDWDEDSWGRGRTPREGRMGDGARPDRRAYERPARSGASSWESERPDRSGRGSARERDAGGLERPRGSQRDDGPGSPRGSRRYGDDAWGSDGGRPNGSTGRGRPPAAGYDDDRNGSRSRTPRDRRDESYDGRGGGSGRENRIGEGPRGPRPPARGDEWETRDRRPGPGAAVARGGLWGDEDAPRRRRPDGSDPRARAGGRPDPRDPRSFRQGLIDTSAQPVPAAKKSRFGFGKAILIILLMFLIGAGAAYGYYRASTPTVHVPATSTPGATPPSSSPAAGVTPSTSPHSNVPAAHPLDVVL